MRITRRVRHHVLIAAIAASALGLTAAGATAFTNSNTFTNTNTVVGYGVENVTGAAVTSISYTLSTDGSTIEGVTFTASGDTHNSVANVGFDQISNSNDASATTACNTGTYNSGTTLTTYVCNNAGSGIGQALDDVSSINIAVH